MASAESRDQTGDIFGSPELVDLVKVGTEPTDARSGAAFFQRALV